MTDTIKNDYKSDLIKLQPIINVGVLGHVAHGKSTLVRSITGIRTQKHSNENKTGRTIKLGYANVKLYQCTSTECGLYYTKPSEVTELVCVCGENCVLINHVSFVDAPGHEFLMTTMLNGAAVMDCAILVIAANEKVPQPQTQEHLVAAEIMGLTNILIVQNKIDTITPQKAEANMKEIKNWVKGTCAENSPIVPISAQKGDGVQKIIESLAKMQISESQKDRKPVFACIRSFDVNRPGNHVSQLQGGVIGGTLLQGTVHLGDEIEVKPGLAKSDGMYIPLKTKILSIQSEKNQLQKAIPGGLIALETTLDPRFTCKDNLVGSIGGVELPELTRELKFKYFLLKGTKFEVNDVLRLTYLSRSVMATVKSNKKRSMKVQLQEPLCLIDRCKKLSISNKIGNQFRLVGVGNIEDENDNNDFDNFKRTFTHPLGHHLDDYDTLLRKISGSCVLQTKKKNMIKISPPECEKQGGVRTVWTNFGKIVTQLDKPMDHFKRFISSELGTTTSVTGTQGLVLYGRFVPSNFESLIRSYVRKYCKCDTCGNHDTDIETSGGTDTVTCKYCGMTKSIYGILKNNAKKGKGGKLNM